MSRKKPQKASPWWSQGVRFECQGSGKCCVSREQYGYVYLTLEDRQRLAKHLGLTTRQFTPQYCAKTRGVFHLKEEPGRMACMFLKGNKCSVYEARPTQCRTWPFWPEVMSPKKWKKEVSQYCPGVGKGPIVSAQQIASTLQAQSQSDEKL